MTMNYSKDKEDILRKSPLLRGTNIYITEDYSRKVRKHREELLRFAKLVKSRQNGVRCLLQYDRLYVDNDVYLYNEVEQRVQRVLMKMPEGGGKVYLSLLECVFFFSLRLVFFQEYSRRHI